jgi:hypothetical protein
MSCDGFGHGERGTQGDGFGTAVPRYEAVSEDWKLPGTAVSGSFDGNGGSWGLDWGSPEVRILCDFDFHNLRSRAINLAVRAEGV